MQVVENVALISINATLVVQLISFLIFMVLFNRIMIRPLRRVMSERDKYMEQVRHQIVKVDLSYQQISQQIVTQESEARKAAMQIRDEIEESGQRSANELIEKTRDDINVLRAKANRETDDKIVVARKSIESEADALADQIILSMLDRRSLT